MPRAEEGDTRSAQLLYSNWDHTGVRHLVGNRGDGIRLGGVAEEYCFVGSKELSGWTPVAEVEVEDSKVQQ